MVAEKLQGEKFPFWQCDQSGCQERSNWACRLVCRRCSSGTVPPSRHVARKQGEGKQKVSTRRGAKSFKDVVVAAAPLEPDDDVAVLRRALAAVPVGHAAHTMLNDQVVLAVQARNNLRPLFSRTLTIVERISHKVTTSANAKAKLETHDALVVEHAKQRLVLLHDVEARESELAALRLQEDAARAEAAAATTTSSLGGFQVPSVHGLLGQVLGVDASEALAQCPESVGLVDKFNASFNELLVGIKTTLDNNAAKAAAEAEAAAAAARDAPAPAPAYAREASRPSNADGQGVEGPRARSRSQGRGTMVVDDPIDDVVGLIMRNAAPGTDENAIREELKRSDFGSVDFGGLSKKVRRCV
jgi:hypothetical protein